MFYFGRQIHVNQLRHIIDGNHNINKVYIKAQYWNQGYMTGLKLREVFLQVT